MKRDMELVRDVLLIVSEDPKYDGVYFNYFQTAEELGIKDHSTEEVAYHVRLLIDAGCLNGRIEESFLIPSIKGLTWSGQEFIDNIKNQDIWERTKKRMVGLSSVALSVIAEIAESEIKRKLHLS
jgi:hypothetical protein